MKKVFQRLTMLAVTVMASMPTFAQSGETTTLKPLAPEGKDDYEMIRFHTVSASNPGEIELIGFAAYVNDGTYPMADDFEGTLTIFNKAKGSATTPNAAVVAVQANAFTSTTLFNDTPNKSDFATCAAQTTTLSFEYDEEYNRPTIGSKAFAGLTSLTQVINDTPGEKLQVLPTDAFATSVYKTAILIAPEGGASKYAQTAGWNKFYKIKNGKSGVILGDINNDGDIDALDLKALRTAVLKKTYSLGADINGDGDVDALDLKKMRQVILRTY